MSKQLITKYVSGPNANCLYFHMTHNTMVCICDADGGTISGVRVSNCKPSPPEDTFEETEALAQDAMDSYPSPEYHNIVTHVVQAMFDITDFTLRREFVSEDVLGFLYTKDNVNISFRFHMAELHIHEQTSDDEEPECSDTDESDDEEESDVDTNPEEDEEENMRIYEKNLKRRMNRDRVVTNGKRMAEYFKTAEFNMRVQREMDHDSRLNNLKAELQEAEDANDQDQANELRDQIGVMELLIRTNCMRKAKLPSSRSSKRQSPIPEFSDDES